jgi:hypothetical protein
MEIGEIWHDAREAIWEKSLELKHWLTPSIDRKEYPARESRSIKLRAALGWVLIVVGVVGEGVFEGVVYRYDLALSVLSESSIAETKREANLALERTSANELAEQELRAKNLKLEATVQPRTISLEDQRKIVDACAAFKGHGAIVQSYGLDTEGFATGSQIIAVLQAMNVVVADDRAYTVSTGRMETGFHVRTTDASEIPFAACIWGAFNNIAKLQTAFNDSAPPFRGAMLGGGGQSINGPHITVMVGTKPLPLLTDKQSTKSNK